MAKISLADIQERLVEIIQECSKQTESKPKPVELQRNIATLPLRGIDIPFYSKFLSNGVKPFTLHIMGPVFFNDNSPSAFIICHRSIFQNRKRENAPFLLLRMPARKPCFGMYGAKRP